MRPPSHCASSGLALLLGLAAPRIGDARPGSLAVKVRSEIVARGTPGDLRWMAGNRDAVYWLLGRVFVKRFLKQEHRTEVFEVEDGTWGSNSVIAADDDNLFFDAGGRLLTLSTHRTLPPYGDIPHEAKPLWSLAKNAILTGITLDADYVYVMEQGRRNSLFKIPKKGGEAKDLGSYGSLGCGRHLVNDATHVYWTDMIDPFIYRVSKDGGRREEFLRIGSPAGLAIDDKELCFANQRPPQVECIDKASRQRRVVGTGKLVYPKALVMDGEYLYFVDQGGEPEPDPDRPELSNWDSRLRVRDGGVYKVPRAGGKITVIAARQDAPIDLLVDEKHVYWLSQRAGMIWRAPK